MSDPEVILLVMPNGGVLPISRELFEDSVESTAPIRDYLNGLESEHPGPFYCPAFERQGTARGPACMGELPCAEHEIQDQNQGHREYGAVIVMAPDQESERT